ncbi:MAG: PKD domain-containing protein [Thermoplasmata archaeon]
MVRKTVLAFFACAVMVLVAAVPLALAEQHEIVKGEKGPRNSAVTWEYVPDSTGVWVGHVTNNGLRWIVVDVYDTSNGVPMQVSHQRIRFAAYDAYPSGELDTNAVPMMLGKTYAITITPNGPRGSSCIVEDTFKALMPPVAVITVTGIEALTVHVSGADSYDPDGSIVSYAWDFGDGAKAMGMTASHTYAMDGDYTITLEVADNDGLKGMDQEVVTVSHEAMPPVAMFTATMDWMTVSVDASASYDPNMLPLAYAWDFGDGSSAMGVTATHTYAMEGTYEITLTVTNAMMLSGTAKQSVVAVMPAPPVAMFTWTAEGNVLYVDASGSSSGVPIVSYAWNWGDGSPIEVLTTATASHTYAKGGTSSLHVVTISAKGVVESAPVISAPPPPPLLLFGYITDSSGKPVGDASVTVTNLGNGMSLTTLSDADGFYMAQLADLYYAAGNTIKIDVVKDGMTGSAQYVVTGSEPGYVQLDITLTGGGPTEHTFEVTLTVTDAWGRTASVTQTVTLLW